MAIKWMQRAFEVEGLTPAEKLVLVKLADHANDEGVCWPGVATVARVVGVDERHARRLIRELEGRGLVVSVSRSGSSNWYVLAMGREASEVKKVCGRLAASASAPSGGAALRSAGYTPGVGVTPDTGVRGPATTGDAGVRPPLTPVSPEPSLNPSSEPVAEPGAAPEIWAKTVEELELSMTRPSLDSWVRPVRPEDVRVEDGCLVVRTRSTYLADWLGERLRRDVERAVMRASGQALGLRVEVVS